MKRANEPDRANRRQPLSFRERVGEPGVMGLAAAVAHPDCWPADWRGVKTGKISREKAQEAQTGRAGSPKSEGRNPKQIQIDGNA